MLASWTPLPRLTFAREKPTIRAGWFSLDFDPAEDGDRRYEFDYGVFLQHVMQINDEQHIGMSIPHKQSAYRNGSAVLRRGRAGIFVTSGSLNIESLIVSD